MFQIKLKDDLSDALFRWHLETFREPANSAEIVINMLIVNPRVLARANSYKLECLCCAKYQPLKLSLLPCTQKYHRYSSCFLLLNRKREQEKKPQVVGV